MNSSQNIPSSRLGFTSRQSALVAILLIVTWAAQLRYPPLSFPAIGLLIMTILVGIAALLTIRSSVQARRLSSPVFKHPAILPGFAFFLWAIARWAAAGFPFTGAADIGTIMWFACYALIAGLLTSDINDNDRNDADSDSNNHPWIVRLFLPAISMIGLLCGLHAVWQYHYGYERDYQRLLAAIGDRVPDRMELSLLYHFQLKRVASVWGDPNTLATFSAISICASIGLIFKQKLIAVFRAGLGLSVVASLLAVYYSGSRGGALDVVFVIIVFGVFWLIKRRKRNAGIAVAILGILLAGGAGGPRLTFAAEPLTSSAATAGNADSKSAESGWKWRSNTIRERVFYLDVGRKMIEMAPLTGLGPGSVELYFGRLKSPEARETKYLHNWPVQTWAETGLIGLILLLWFLTAIGFSAWKRRLYRNPIGLAYCSIFALIILDGLIQVSWSQREIMSTFGICSGVLIGLTNKHAVTRNAISSSKIQTARLAGAGLIILLFAWHETRFLAGASNKQIARDAMAMGDLTTANKHWRRAEQWTPNDPDPYAARSNIALNENRYSAARSLIEKALDAYPESAALHAEAAEIYGRLRQDDKVDEYLTKALQIYPTKPEYNYQYAQYLEAHDHLTTALQYALRAEKYNYFDQADAKYSDYVRELKSKLNDKTEPGKP